MLTCFAFKKKLTILSSYFQTPLVVFLPGKSHGRGAWQVTVHGVAESDLTEATWHGIVLVFSALTICQYQRFGLFWANQFLFLRL